MKHTEVYLNWEFLFPFLLSGQGSWLWETMPRALFFWYLPLIQASRTGFQVCGREQVLILQLASLQQLVKLSTELSWFSFHPFLYAFNIFEHLLALRILSLIPMKCDLQFSLMSEQLRGMQGGFLFQAPWCLTSLDLFKWAPFMILLRGHPQVLLEQSGDFVSNAVQSTQVIFWTKWKVFSYIDLETYCTYI